MFEEGPLFLCDVKMDHFGTSDHGRVKVIDSDSAGFQSVIGNLMLFCTVVHNFYILYFLERSLGPLQNCTSHAECDYFDCRGRCDLVSEKCAGEIVNDNLQVRPCSHR